MTEGVSLDSLNLARPLAETESCLEFLLISLCGSLGLKPKQAVGLLAHELQYLKKVLARGLKGDFTPVQGWYQALYADSERLSWLLQQRPEELNTTLTVLGQGLVSADLPVRQWTCKLLSKQSFELEELGLMEPLWRWFTETAVQLLLPLCESECAEDAVDVLLHLSQGRLLPLFSEVLAAALPLPSRYLSFLATVLEILCLSTSAKTDLQDSGVTVFVRDLALRQAESVHSDCRLTALLVLRSLWLHFPLDHNIESALKRGMNDRLELIRASCAVLLLEALEASSDTPQAAGLYKALTLKLGAEVADSNTDYLLLHGFCRLLIAAPHLPLTPLLDILTPKYHSSSWTLADLELLQQLALHEHLSLPQSVQLLDLCAQIYFSAPAYARTACGLMRLLVKRYAGSAATLEYVKKLGQLLLKAALVGERSLHVGLLRWLLEQEALKEGLQSELLEAYSQRKETKEPLNVKALMTELGYSPAVEAPVASLERPSRSQPLQKVLLDLERLKQQRQAKLVSKQNLQTQLAQAAQQQAKALRQQLEIRRVEQGLSRGVAQDTAALYPFDSVPRPQVEETLREISPEESQLTQVVTRKYYRVLKALFVKHSGTGFAVRQEAGFQWLAQRKARMTEAELLKVLSLCQVVPVQLTKEEVRTLLRAYCSKVAQQHDLASVDFQGFTGLVTQLACCIAAKGPAASWPPALQLKQLMLHFRSNVQGIALDLFDEPDPGHGDKEVVKRLNAQLRTDSEAEIPEGYKVAEEQDIETRFAVPQCLTLSEGLTVCLETLDLLLNDGVGIHILEPVAVLLTRKCAKGVKQKNSESPPRASTEAYSQPNLSPSLRFEVARFPVHLRPLATECAFTLESLLLSVSLGLSRLIHRPSAPRLLLRHPFSEPALVKIKDKAHWQRRQKEAQQRMQRYMQEKLEKQRKEQEEEAQKALAQAEENRRLAQRAAREKEARARQLSLWHAEKEEEKKKVSVVETERTTAEAKHKDVETYKRVQSRLEAVLKAKQEQRRAAEESRLSEIQRSSEEKQAVQLRSARLLEQDRARSQLKAQNFQRFATSEAVQRLLSLHAKGLQALYEYFCKRAEFRLEAAAGLCLRDYAKMAVVLELVPTWLSAEANSTVFKTVTKAKPAPGNLDYHDFTEALLLVAEVAKDKLNVQAGLTGTELSTETFAALLHLLRVDRETGLTEFLTVAERKRTHSKDLALTERSQSKLKRALGRSKSARRALKSAKEV